MLSFVSETSFARRFEMFFIERGGVIFRPIFRPPPVERDLYPDGFYRVSNFLQE